MFLNPHWFAFWISFCNLRMSLLAIFISECHFMATFNVLLWYIKSNSNPLSISNNECFPISHYMYEWKFQKINSPSIHQVLEEYEYQGYSTSYQFKTSMSFIDHRYSALINLSSISYDLEIFSNVLVTRWRFN